MHRRALLPKPFGPPQPAGTPGPSGRCCPAAPPGPAAGRMPWPGGLTGLTGLTGLAQLARPAWALRLSRLARPAALAGAVALAASFTPAAQAARYALVIGNDAYQPPLRPLQNAAKDARDIAAELRASGFQVPDKWVVINATRRRMDAALQDFLASIGDGDEVVFFYGGHGVEIDAQAALVPVDLSDPSRRPLDNSLRPLTELDQAKRQVLDESITLNRVAADIARKNLAFSLLVVDACRDNPVLDLLRAAHAAYPGRNAGPPPEAGLIADAQADTQVLLFSASKGQQSLDRLGSNDPVRNGVFTRVLLDVMRTPGLGLREMLPRVKAEVKRLAATVRLNGQPHRQEPRSMAAFDAPNFFFRPGQGGSVVAAAPLTQPAPAVPSAQPLPPAATVTLPAPNPSQAQAPAPAPAAVSVPAAASAPPPVAAGPMQATTPAAAAAVVPPLLDGRYQVLGDGSEVKDLQTSLVWARCSVGQTWDGLTCVGKTRRFTFDEAQKLAGNGWRVPKVRELASLIRCSNGKTRDSIDPEDGRGPLAHTCQGASNGPTVPQAAFPSTEGYWYWTSSPAAGFRDLAWFVYFGDGVINPKSRSDDLMVRLVRASPR